MEKGKFKQFYYMEPGSRDLTSFTSESQLGGDAYLNSRDQEAGFLRNFISQELGIDRKDKGGSKPKHMQYLQSHEVLDYSELSDKGNFKFFPVGNFQFSQLDKYAEQIAQQLGAYAIRNPVIVRRGHPSVEKLVGEFHEHIYAVRGGDNEFFLRPASDPVVFPIAQNLEYTEDQTPVRVKELALCHRYEDSGSLSGLARLRGFNMPDFHSFCKSEEQGMDEFEKFSLRYRDLMNDTISRGYWVFGWEGTVDFFEDHKDWILSMSQEMGVPVFFKLMDEMSHYYALKNEFQGMLSDGSTTQISTVQYDVKNGERFQIGHIDSQGNKHPAEVIIHASIGSIERILCGIYEANAIEEKMGKRPQYPLWLAPTQVRMVPMNGDLLELADNYASELNRMGVRADVDDRLNRQFNKNVRAADVDWVPYVSVIGRKEAESGKLNIRRRSDRAQETVSLDELVSIIKSRTEGMPHTPLPYPQRVSQRVKFR